MRCIEGLADIIVRLKQLDAIARRIVEQYLLPTPAHHDVVPETCASFTKRLNQALEIVHLKLDAIPAARFGLPPVWHGLSRSSAATRDIEQQFEITAREHRESWRRFHLHLETKMLGVERCGRLYVIDNVTNTH